MSKITTTCEDIDSSSLLSIGGTLYLYENDVYYDFAAPVLEEIGGSFQVYYHWSQGIETIYMPTLESISGDFYVYYNYNIREIDLSSLTDVGSQFYLYEADDLDVLELGSPEEVGSNFYLYGSTSLDTLDLDSLLDINGSMTVSYNTGLQSFSAPLLADLADSLNIQENTQLNAIDLSSLVCIDDYTITGNDLSEEDQYDLLVQLTCASEDSLVVFLSEDADDWCASGETEVENLYINALGTDPIDLSCIETVIGYLEIENSIAPSIDLSGCTSIGDELYIHDNDDLTSIDLSALTTVDSYVYIYANSDLETVNLRSLQTIDSYFYVQNHDNLQDIDLSSLLSIGGTLYLYENDVYYDFAAPVLEEIGGSFQVYYHWSQGIETIYMPTLESISGDFYVYYNYNIREIDLSSLTDVGSQFYLYEADDLDVLELGSLEEVGSNFYLYGSTSLDTLDLDSLLDINGSMTVSYNTDSNPSAPLLADLADSLNIQENTQLNAIDLSSLVCIDDYNIEGNDLSEEDQYDLLVQLTCAAEGSLVVFSSEDADDWCASGETVVDDVYINATGTDPVDLSCIETITGYLEIENSNAPSINLSGCTSIGDELYIHDNDDLTSIDLSALTTVDSYVYIYANNRLGDTRLA